MTYVRKNKANLNYYLCRWSKIGGPLRGITAFPVLVLAWAIGLCLVALLAIAMPFVGACLLSRKSFGPGRWIADECNTNDAIGHGYRTYWPGD